MQISLNYHSLADWTGNWFILLEYFKTLQVNPNNTVVWMVPILSWIFRLFQGLKLWTVSLSLSCFIFFQFSSEIQVFIQYLLLLLSLLYYSLWVFHISISWWSFTRIWVTASLLKSPGLLSVFWPILTMLFFGWSWFILWFLTLSASLPIGDYSFSLLTNWGLFQACQLQLVLPSPSCSTAFLVL